MPSLENTLKITAVEGDEAERECDSCDDTVDDSGLKITVSVDNRTAEFFLCEECLVDNLNISERAVAKK